MYQSIRRRGASLHGRNQVHESRRPLNEDRAGRASCASLNDSTEAGVRRREVPRLVNEKGRTSESSRIEVTQDCKIAKKRSAEVLDGDSPVYIFSYIFNYATSEWEHYDGYVIGDVYVSSEDIKEYVDHGFESRD